MKATLTAVLLLATLAASQTLTDFHAWAKRHGKVYTANEEARRFLIYKANLATIERLNLENHGARFGPNKFTDLTNEEFARLYTTKFLGLPKGEVEVPDRSATDIKDNIDYRDWLPPVKDQGQCGSCWAFGAIANMEGQFFMHNKTKMAFSEQQLVSCDKGFNMGCNGGSPSMADLYVIRHGIATMESYPYTSGTGDSGKCKPFEPYAFFRSMEQFNLAKESTIFEAFQTYGPLTAGVEADREVFQHYESGILDSDHCGKLVNHAVTLVGYGTENGVDYWTIRNSWSADWGDKGYIRLVRGKNMCGIQEQLSTIKY